MDEGLKTFIEFAQANFSVVVAGYLLIRMEERLSKLTEAIAELRGLLEPKE